ncbi:LLM class flavin-dependent oxidoreductase [Emcibacter sp. SYSU 3D8]|uniref:LLM class flavin-dependent oxidoreductase n=1 Tax=Emcibacter sp. SYSU 3D8 TaxID=3133969 RepID=UPI0031FEC653
MEFFANLPMPLAGNPADWAREREAEGWHGICASDHLWVGQTVYPHVFVVLSAMAAATTRIRLTSSFANNLFRSPVEFAQASLTLNWLSGGRFEPGLGAGWMCQEMTATGRVFPDGPTRVSMYREALVIVRDLLRTGTCRFKGEYYNIDITDPRMACVMDPPPDLIGSASGPRALREITPLVDRLEITASGRALRGGALDMAAYASITEHEVREAVARARAVREDVPIGTYIMIAAGDDPRVRGMETALGGNFFFAFCRSARKRGAGAARSGRPRLRPGPAYAGLSRLADGRRPASGAGLSRPVC